MIYTLARHELLRTFKTGKAWKLLSLFQLLLGFIFYSLLGEFLVNHENQFLESSRRFGITEEVVHPLFAWSALILFIIIPVLSMTSLAYERKNRTLDLYLTMPLSSQELILGKFLGNLALLSLLFVPSILMPLIILVNGHLDFGHYGCGLFGLWLVLTTALSICMLVSTYTKEPLTAIIFGIFALLFLSLLEWTIRFLDPAWHVIREFALLYHCKNLFSGIVTFSDVSYYCLLSTVCLFLSAKRIEKEPLWRGKHGF